MPRLELSRPAKREVLLVCALFVTGALTGMIYVASWGQTADILQTSFGPSVMLACGHGFVNPKASAVPELVAFLRPDLHHDGPPVIDQFSCGLLPEAMPTVPFTGIHKRTWHMFWIAGWIWRVFGVAWPSLTPLYGVLFGLSAVAAYGIFRIVLNQPIALFCSLLFLMSPVQLHYLPRLRDFAKAPFMLLALFCLLLLLVHARGWKRALWAGGLAGAAIGLATGFRAEAVLYVVVFVPAVLLFYPGWRWPAWGNRAVAVTAFLVCFLLAGWPVLMKFQTYGERTHPFLMGFGHFFDGRLGVDNPYYQLSHTDLDTEALAQHNAHNRYLDSAAPPIIYETPGYEAVGDDYFVRNLLGIFTGDLATRTAAAGLRTLDELRPNPQVPMPRGLTHAFLEPLYEARAGLMDTLFSRTRYVALALLLLLGAWSPRLGLAVLYLGFCLAGMASVQFATRHYFHLEFIALLVGGVVLQGVWWSAVLLGHSGWRARLRHHVLSRPWLTAHVKRGLVFGAAAGLLVAVPWMALRWHQDRQMKDLFAAYAAAELETVWPTIAAVEHDMVRLACGPLTPEAGLPVVGPEGHFEVDMIVAEFEPGETPIPIDFVYTGDTPDRNISWRTTIQPVERDAAVTRYYFPVYNAVWPETPDNLSWNDVDVPWTRFDGIALHAKDLPRLRGLQRFKYAAGYTPLLTAVLEPGWEERPLYQQFVR